MTDDLRAALEPVADAFTALGVTYRVGGSVASSAFGVARTTLDIDVVADLQATHVAPLVALLEADYYVDADMIHDAIRRRASFNVIHLGTMLKVDVLEWYRLGGETSERQWGDVLGVLKLQGDHLDRAHLAHWATELGISDLLARALAEAGLSTGP